MIRKDDIYNYSSLFIKDKSNLVKQRILYKTPIVDLISSGEFDKKEVFDLELEIGNQYNQKHTGRCWCFAASRIINKNIGEILNDSSFELSIDYLMFFDKLEKFNLLMKKFNKNEKNCYERELSEALLNGIVDGGYFTWFANLVDKYGIVPKNCFPESYQSNNTNEINNILSRLLRKFYIEVNSNNYEELHYKYLQKAFNILCLLCGVPPKKFNFSYIDNNKVKKSMNDITPLQFYRNYSNINLLKDYVEVISYKDDKYEYNKLYEIDKLTNVEEYSNIRFLNLSTRRQKDLIIKQLYDNEPVCFYSYVTKKQIKGTFTDLYEKYSDLLNIDLNISKNDILFTNETKNGHAMIISGLKLKNGLPEKYKILNSWPEKDKNIKYYVADNSWLDKYVSCVVINKKHLKEKELKILCDEPYIINYWDNKIN